MRYVFIICSVAAIDQQPQYIENKKAGQKQIFYVSDAGKSADSLAKSVFVEKLHARGYEVLLLTDPIDDVLLHHLRKWKWVPMSLCNSLVDFAPEVYPSRTQQRPGWYLATRVSLEGVLFACIRFLHHGQISILKKRRLDRRRIRRDSCLFWIG